MKIRIRQLLGLVVAVPCALAAQVNPSSYDMPNGSTGNYSYWDESYTGLGCKTCDGAALTGGLGDLTDGVIASASWNVVEAPAGPGPYVGWANIDPTITFHFSQSVSIDSVIFSFDDSNLAGVTAPGSVTIAGQTFAVVNPVGSEPFSFAVSGLSFVGNTLPVVIHRTGSWSFVSEISFASAVPEPDSGAMMLAGLAVGLGIVMRRKASTSGRV